MNHSIKLLLLPIVVTIHNLEELLWLPQWSQSGKGPAIINAVPFTYSVVFITLLIWVLWYLHFFNNRKSIPHKMFVGYAGAMFLNIFFPHIVGSIIYREILPGTATAILCITPTTLYLWLNFFKHKYKSKQIALYTLSMTLLLLTIIALTFYIFTML